MKDQTEIILTAVYDVTKSAIIHRKFSVANSRNISHKVKEYYFFLFLYLAWLNINKRKYISFWYFYSIFGYIRLNKIKRYYEEFLLMFVLFIFCHSQIRQMYYKHKISGGAITDDAVFQNRDRHQRKTVICWNGATNVSSPNNARSFTPQRWRTIAAGGEFSLHLPLSLTEPELLLLLFLQRKMICLTEMNLHQEPRYAENSDDSDVVPLNKSKTKLPHLRDYWLFNQHPRYILYCMESPQHIQSDVLPGAFTE